MCPRQYIQQQLQRPSPIVLLLELEIHAHVEPALIHDSHVFALHVANDGCGAADPPAVQATEKTIEENISYSIGTSFGDVMLQPCIQGTVHAVHVPYISELLLENMKLNDRAL